jgi:hypothetical protein
LQKNCIRGARFYNSDPDDGAAVRIDPIVVAIDPIVIAAASRSHLVAVVSSGLRGSQPRVCAGAGGEVRRKRVVKSGGIRAVVVIVR